jgi:hypothetical protein
MLSKSSPETPTTTFAFADRSRVQLIQGLMCPCCKRELQASDVTIDSGGIILICNRCHHDLISIGH